MQEAILEGAQLQSVHLGWAQLQEADLNETQAQGAKLEGAQLQKAKLLRAQLQEAHLGWAQLQKADLYMAQLQKANLREAQLQKAHLVKVDLQEAFLYRAELQGADLREAQLQGADLREAQLAGAHLNETTLSDERDGTVLLADVRWGEINLAVVDWTPVEMLGDEHQAHQTKDIDDYRAAVRANRQLAVALQTQGLNEEAAHFAYYAQVLQKCVLWFQMTQQRAPLRQRTQAMGGLFFSWFLFLLAGYGYRPGRSVFWYLATIIVFALGYHVFGSLSLWPPDALVYSLTSFHGRGFFPGLEGKHSLHDPLIMFAAIEAVVGLFIEISFIATFTQRFFGK